MEKTENEVVCGVCFRLFDLLTGEVVKGWERVRFVSGTDHMCLPCRNPIIDGLQAQLAATL